MLHLVTETFAFFFRQSPHTTWRRIRSREVPWQIQFLMYCFCGVLATFVSVGLTVLFSTYLIPAYEGMLVDGEPISDELRSRNLTLNSCLAFVPTNFVVYALNVLLVFKPGKLGLWKELGLFTAVNLFSFIVSLLSGPMLIYYLGISTNFALLINTVVAFAVNFAARKFLIFRK